MQFNCFEDLIAPGEERMAPGVFAFSEDVAGIIRRAEERIIDTDVLYVLFTSGSTGTPKGVIICHRSVIDYIEWASETFLFGHESVFGNQAPFYFDNSVLDIYSTIRNGSKMHIIPESYFAFPARLLEHIAEKEINTIFWVPTVLVTVDCTYYIVDREIRDTEPVPIGRPCRNSDILVLNENNEMVKGDEKGELCVRGSSLALGYYGNPEKTEAAFVQNPLNKLYPEKIYRTGDLVHYNERGEIIYDGRNDSQVKHSGHRIELGEIETAVSSIPGILMNACLHDRKDNQLILFFVGDAEEQEIKKALTGLLPRYMIPNQIIALKEMPLNMNGKIDRQKLRLRGGGE